ncbi:MAG: phosphomannomutase/phosphoglucomutase [Saccharospirillaceae bacterium]|nr:phosphomannomutase/phosphoglucomutase [Pseudomonadales bacterium]NRB78512.1 phosphomannomutase/phosphoglucomutase [Saccharospirillaceae bacterium]
MANHSQKEKQQKKQKRRSIFSFLIPSIIAVVVILPLSAVLLILTTVEPTNSKYKNSVVKIYSQAIANNINAQLMEKQGVIKKYADSQEIITLVQNADLNAISVLEQNMMLSIESVKQVRLTLLELANPTDGRFPELGYPGTSIIRDVEKGGVVAPQYYPREQGGDVILIVFPVLAESGEIIATLSASFGISYLENVLKAHSKNAGALELVQALPFEATQNIAKFGKATRKNAIDIDLSIQYWKLYYTPNPEIINYQVVNSSDYWIWMIIIILIMLVAIILPVWNLQKIVRKETASVAVYVQKVLAGQQQAAPDVSIALYSSLLESLSRVRFSRQNTTQANAQKDNLTEDLLLSSPSGSASAVLDLDDDMAQLDQIPNLDLELGGSEQSIMSLHLGADHDRLGIESAQDHAPIPNQGLAVTRELFDGLDICGQVGENLDNSIARIIGLAIGSEAADRGEQPIVVGRDGRLSSSELTRALILGLTESGRDVLDLGLVPTPLMYYATKILGVNSGVMVTGGKHSANYNGMKIILGGHALLPEEVAALYTRIESRNLLSGNGSVTQNNIVNNYIKRISSDVKVNKKLKVVIDAGNGVAANVAPALFDAMGCEVIPLYCEVDGNFPNHTPNPSNVKNLVDLQNAVKEHNADIGFAFDGEGDRIGMVTNEGTVILPDRILMLLAKNLLQRKSNSVVIHDTRSTRRLKALIVGYGGRAIMSKSGSAIIKRKMKETGALLAGEMDGHIYFRERWYGFDDALYAAARILEVVSQDTKTVEAIFASFPEDSTTQDIPVSVPQNLKYEILERLTREGKFPNGTIIELDGLRIDFPDGWGLIRPHATKNQLIMKFEANTPSSLRKIQETFKLQMLIIDSKLQFPY